MPKLSLDGLFARMAALAVFGSCAAYAANDTDPLADTKPDDASYQHQVRKMLPVAYWSFDAGEPDIGEVEGNLAFGRPGPTTEDFRSFQKGNKAVEFGAGGNYIVVEDPGDGSQFDFDNGDPITIEAWVNPGKIGKNENNLHHWQGPHRKCRLRCPQPELRPSPVGKKRQAAHQFPVSQPAGGSSQGRLAPLDLHFGHRSGVRVASRGSDLPLRNAGQHSRLHRR